jgi:hypothetical protein
MTTTTSRPTAPITAPTTAPTTVSTRALRYSRQTSAVLLTAFTGSAAYTVYTTLAGLPEAGFSATDPIAWAFYGVAFAVALAVRTDRLAVWWVLAVLLPLLLAVAVLVYPASFGPELQTPVGWLENDAYTGLLVLALYLVVQRLRRTALTA